MKDVVDQCLGVGEGGFSVVIGPIVVVFGALEVVGISVVDVVVGFSVDVVLGASVVVVVVVVDVVVFWVVVSGSTVVVLKTIIKKKLTNQASKIHNSSYFSFDIEVVGSGTSVVSGFTADNISAVSMNKLITGINNESS